MAKTAVEWAVSFREDDVYVVIAVIRARKMQMRTSRNQVLALTNKSSSSPQNWRKLRRAFKN
jgi:hypothetical protein